VNSASVPLLGTRRVFHRAGSTIVPSSVAPRMLRPSKPIGSDNRVRFHTACNRGESRVVVSWFRLQAVARLGTTRFFHSARSTIVPSSVAPRTPRPWEPIGSNNRVRFPTACNPGESRVVVNWFRLQAVAPVPPDR
jgi:hypothetical protein